jgi:creatinine amidohydrolase
MTWPAVAGRAEQTLLVVPVGSTEQHGPHLPLSTDTDIAVHLARALAATRPDVAVAPAVAYGSSGEHAGFPGTLSIGQAALEHLLIELVRSADAFAGVLLISAHGGNAAPVGRAVEVLRGEGRPVRVWAPGGDDPCDSHAGRAETSVMLALDPGAVTDSAVAPGTIRPLAELMPELRAGGVAAVSDTGVLGDPSRATAEHGRSLLARWRSQLLAAVAGWP